MGLVNTPKELIICGQFSVVQECLAVSGENIMPRNPVFILHYTVIGLYYIVLTGNLHMKSGNSKWTLKLRKIRV